MVGPSNVYYQLKITGIMLNKLASALLGHYGK